MTPPVPRQTARTPLATTPHGTRTIHFGRDGELSVSDDNKGYIYRIASGKK